MARASSWSLLDRAFAKAAGLAKTEQEAIAALVLVELDSERKWDELLRHIKQVHTASVVRLGGTGGR